jgi:hypothetical protein
MVARTQLSMCWNHSVDLSRVQGFVSAPVRQLVKSDLASEPIDSTAETLTWQDKVIVSTKCDFDFDQRFSEFFFLPFLPPLAEHVVLH